MKKRANMPLEPRSIAQQINCLAQLTGAPASFVGQVCELFSSKGIPLEADAAPYIGALEEAFTREESIRASTERARNNVARLQSNFRKIGQAHASQVRERRRARGRTRPSASDDSTTEIVVDGDHRSFVTPLQTERFPMVPGPEETQ